MTEDDADTANALGRDLYTPDEAATLLGMTPRMLADRRRDGRIGCFKDGHYIGFSRRHLDDYRRTIEARGVSPRESRQGEVVVVSLKSDRAKALISQLTGGREGRPRSLRDA